MEEEKNSSTPNPLSEKWGTLSKTPFSGEAASPNWVDAEKRRGTKLVVMGYNRQIVLDADDKRIATFGLGGCTAVCALAEKDGNWVGYIQHYPPIQREESMKALEHFRNSVSGDIQAVAIMSPGEWVKDDQTGKWTMVFKDSGLADKLAGCCTKDDEKLPQIINVPYSEDRSGRYGEGTLAAGTRNGELYIEAEGIPIIRKPVNDD